MSITIDENIVAIWYIQLSRGSDWMAALSAIPGEPNKFELNYRFRYYTDPNFNAFDSKDVKNWYKGIATGTRDECFGKMRYATAVLAVANGLRESDCYELINDFKTMDEFIEAFQKMPFVTMKVVDKDGNEIPPAPATNTTDTPN